MTSLKRVRVKERESKSCFAKIYSGFVIMRPLATNRYAQLDNVALLV